MDYSSIIYINKIPYTTLGCEKLTEKNLYVSIEAYKEEMRGLVQDKDEYEVFEPSGLEKKAEKELAKKGE